MKKIFLFFIISVFLFVSFSSAFSFAKSPRERKEMEAFRKIEKRWEKTIEYLETKGKKRDGQAFLKLKKIYTKHLIRVLFDDKFTEKKISKREIDRRAQKLFAAVHPDRYAAKQNEERAQQIYYAVDELKNELLIRLESDGFVKVVGGNRYLKVDKSNRWFSNNRLIMDMNRKDAAEWGGISKEFNDFFKKVIKSLFGGGRSSKKSCKKVCYNGRCYKKCT